MTHVAILPYSLTSSEPGKANIVGIDPYELVTSPSTQFNILKSYELRIDEMTINNSNIPDAEKERFNIRRSIIMIYRTNFIVENMIITTEYADIYDNPVFFLPIHIQSKHVTYKDIHFGVSGTIHYVYDPINLNILNVEIDFYRNSGGFGMDGN